MGIDVNKYFTSGNSLKAADLPQGKQIKVIIEDCTEVEFKGDDGKEQQKLRLSFAGKEKGLILNKTNAMTIAAQYGSNTDAWKGKPIFIYSTKVDFGGTMVDAIRVNMPMESVESDQDIPW